MLSTGRLRNTSSSTPVPSILYADGTTQRSAEELERLHVKKRLRVSSTSLFFDDADFNQNLIVRGNLTVEGDVINTKLAYLAGNNIFTGINSFNNTLNVNGLTILSSGNQTTFQRSGLSSSLRFRVYDQNNIASDITFLGATSGMQGPHLTIPGRVILGHPTIGTERHLFTSYISFIDASNVNEIQRARHHAIGTNYFIENMRDGGMTSLNARMGPDPGGAGSANGTMTTMLRSSANVMEIFPSSSLSSPARLDIGSGTHINQFVPTGDTNAQSSEGVEQNMLRRTSIRRRLLNTAQYLNGSSVSTFQVLDWEGNRGMYINPNSTQGSLNNLVRTNDVVLGALGGNQDANKQLTITCWAAIPLGLRISHLAPLVGQVQLRANASSFIIHSDTFASLNVPLRFNSNSATHRIIQNLTSLSFIHNNYNTGDTVQEDFNITVNDANNQVRFTSLRNNMLFVFQTRVNDVLDNKLIISNSNVNVQRAQLRVSSVEPDLNLQRQIIIRPENDGNHYLQITNTLATSPNTQNRLIIALGRSNGLPLPDTAIISDEVFYFRETNHTSTKRIDLPSLRFTGDNTEQTSAFTDTIKAKVDAIGSSIIWNPHLYAINPSPSYQLLNSLTPNPLSLPPGTYLINTNVTIGTLGSPKTFDKFFTMLNTTMSIPVGIWRPSLTGVPSAFLGDYSYSSAISSFVATVTLNTSLGFYLWLESNATNFEIRIHFSATRIA